MITNSKICIIGGGFFGLYIAEHLSKYGNMVDVYESNSDVMKRASYNNQARVHNGYHYPRSILTALRSKVSYPKFNIEFENAIYNKFDKLYLISELNGNISCNQFEGFCNRIGSKCIEVTKEYSQLINSKLIDKIYKTDENVFNADTIRDIMLERIKDSNVTIKRNTKVLNISDDLKIEFRDSTNKLNTSRPYEVVFNCTYSNINTISNESGGFINLKHEITELCVVQVPDMYKNIGITVMCGPFFSIIPFPSIKDMHTLSHVRYTPHYSINESKSKVNLDDLIKVSNSNFIKMKRDAQRYVSFLKDINYKKSLYEIKTVLPASEVDDSRPILFKKNCYNIKNYHVVLGGKIDNVYEVITELNKI